jgi:hypothetical protein
VEIVNKVEGVRINLWKKELEMPSLKALIALGSMLYALVHSCIVPLCKNSNSHAMLGDALAHNELKYVLAAMCPCSESCRAGRVNPS